MEISILKVLEYGWGALVLVIGFLWRQNSKTADEARAAMKMASENAVRTEALSKALDDKWDMLLNEMKDIKRTLREILSAK